MYSDSAPAMAKKSPRRSNRSDGEGETESNVPEYRLADGVGHRDEGLAVVAIE